MSRNLVMIMAAWLLLTFATIGGCTTSHVYVSTGTAAKAGQRAHLEADIATEINSEITGVRK